MDKKASKYRFECKYSPRVACTNAKSIYKH